MIVSPWCYQKMDLWMSIAVVFLTEFGAAVSPDRDIEGRSTVESVWDIVIKETHVWQGLSGYTENKSTRFI